MARNKYEQEFKDKIVQEYKNGKSKAQIKKEYNLSFNTMNHWINNENSIDVGNVKYSDDIRKQVLNDYVNGLNVPTLSKKYLIKTGTIYSWTKQEGISRHRGKLSLCKNEDFFDNIDSELKAYMLGFIIADGNVSIYNNQYSLKIKIQYEDRYLLERLLKELDCTNTINNDIYQKSPTSDNIYRYSYVSITSKHLVESLIKLKVIPAKTGYEELPYIPEKFVRHMIRGFFDGDGVACCTDKTKSFGFVGNGKIIDQLKDILNWHDVYAEPHWVTPNLYQMQTSSNKRLLNLYHYMYDNCSFYLTRKYEKFTRALNL